MFWFLISCVVTFSLSLFLIRRAETLLLLDVPGERKVHSIPTPRTGGIAISLGCFATLAISLAFNRTWLIIPWQTTLAGSGFLVLGALDDRFGFKPRQKILWFAFFAFLAAWPWAYGGLPGTPYITQVGPWLFMAPRWLAYSLLALWFLAVPNAVNIEDAINGHMGGFLLIMLIVASLSGVNVSIPMGAIVAFLILNWPKAKHFLGDAGSFGCGFLIAEVLLRAGGSHRPLLALSLTAPISMDVCMGIVRRIRLKQSLFCADQWTLPHHLAIRLKSHAMASLVLWANTAIVAALTYGVPVTTPFYLVFFGAVIFMLNRHLLLGGLRTNPSNDLISSR